VSPSRSKKPPKKPARVGRPRVLGPAIPPPEPKIAPSLPPAQTGTDTAPSSYDTRTVCPRCGTRNGRERKDCAICELNLKDVHPAKPGWWLPPDSKVRRISLQIIAMRLAGMEDEEIAHDLGISPKSIRPYVYRAGKNGWLNLDSPRERLEIAIANKAVDKLEEMLGDDRVLSRGEKIISHEAAIETLKGTVFKTFGEPVPQQQAQTVVAVKIEMPEGAVQTIREDTTGGTPAYVGDDHVDGRILAHDD
jgi:hypothetical protein